LAKVKINNIMVISGYVFDEYGVLPSVNIWEGNNNKGYYSVNVSSPLSQVRFTYAAMKEKSFLASTLQTQPNVIMELDTMLDTVEVEFNVKKKKNISGLVLGGLAAFLLLVGISSKGK
jgi:hypothetical protein